MDARQLKIAAAQAALEHVEDGMRLGIGTGSTADEFLRLLAEKVAGGFKVQGVPHLRAHGAALPPNSACRCFPSTICRSWIRPLTAPNEVLWLRCRLVQGWAGGPLCLPREKTMAPPQSSAD